MQLRNRFRVAAYAVTVLGLAVNAHADISGSAWLVTDTGVAGNCGENAIIGCIPGSGANATFSVNNTGLTKGFTSIGTNGTIDQFILSDTGNVTSGPTFANGATTSTLLNVPHTAGSGTNFGGCNSNNTVCSTIFEFTGTALFTHNESFTVNSDDGVTLYVGGTALGNIVLTSPGPQSLSTTTGQYTGATGTFAFTFVYEECCSLPAIFNTNLSAGGNTSVPEPGSIVLFGSVLLGVGLKLRRRKIA